MLELLVQNYDLSDVIHQAIIAVLLMFLVMRPVKIRWRAPI